MKKLIAFMLIAALIFCCVGCTPEVPEVTDPSGTKPTETDPTGSDQTDGTEDPTDSDEPEVLKYSWEQIDFHLGSRYVDGPATIFIFTSPEELQNSHYEEYEFAEKYDKSHEWVSKYQNSKEWENYALYLSEYGGIQWDTDGVGGWGYGNGPKTIEEFYERYEYLTKALVDSPYICGFCYTQLYDVEQEVNGLYTYERVPKFDMKKIKAITSAKKDK